MEPTSQRDSSEERRRDEFFEMELRESRKKRVQNDSQQVAGYSFRLGRVPVTLSPVEYRIVRFLSEHPYKAYTKPQIAEAVSSAETPVTEGTLDNHIQTLREKLGIFSDYIQSVPYIGYRFKP